MEVNWKAYNEDKRPLQVRLDEYMTGLVDSEENKSSFMRDAVNTVYEQDLFIKCPTCVGEGTIYSGTNKAPRKLPKPKANMDFDYKGNKIHNFRCEPELVEKLGQERSKTEFVTLALLLAYSKRGKMECPTCKGAGKIMAGPEKRKKARF